LTDIKPALRLDKWLWYARFFKTRSLSAKLITGGHVRVNGNKISKASTVVAVGDTLTFAQGREIRIVRILSTGVRRGPAPEARLLYDDLSPPVPSAKTASPDAEPDRKGRPTKQDRKAILKFKSELE